MLQNICLAYEENHSITDKLSLHKKVYKLEQFENINTDEVFKVIDRLSY